MMLMHHLRGGGRITQCDTIRYDIGVSEYYKIFEMAQHVDVLYDTRMSSYSPLTKHDTYKVFRGVEWSTF